MRDLPRLYVAIDGVRIVDLASYFVDPDGDELVFTASTPAPELMTVTVSGDSMKLTGIPRGETTVTGEDDDGESVTDSFDVKVAETVVWRDDFRRDSLGDEWEKKIWREGETIELK